MSEVLDPIRTHLERVRRTLLPEPGRMQETFAEHQAIYQAIAAKDADRARGEIANHLDRVACELQLFATRHPDFFDS
jgi:DNA-binding FadR family transcriptional regulator